MHVWKTKKYIYHQVCKRKPNKQHNQTRIANTARKITRLGTNEILELKIPAMILGRDYTAYKYNYSNGKLYG